MNAHALYHNMMQMSSSMSNKSFAVLIKKAIAKMPDTLNTKKEVVLYFRDELDRIVLTKKAAAKAKKTAEAAEKVVEKARKAADKADEKAAEKAAKKAAKAKAAKAKADKTKKERKSPTRRKKTSH